MDDVSNSTLKTLTKEERFISGRQSCKGCGKALTVRIAAKVVTDTPEVPETPEFEISGQSVSLTSHAYNYNTPAATNMIRQFLSAADEINATSGQNKQAPGSSFQKAVIAIDRYVLMDDYLALTEIVADTDNALFICFDNDPLITALIKKAIPQPFNQNESHPSVTSQDVIQAMNQKTMPSLVEDGSFAYVATACSSYPRDFIKKIKHALKTQGNCFILALTPCPMDWLFSSNQSLNMGKKAVETGYFPLYEVLEGNTHLTKRPSKLKPLEEFIGAQRRFQTFPPELVPIMETAVRGYYEKLINNSEVGDES